LDRNVLLKSEDDLIVLKINSKMNTKIYNLKFYLL